MQPAGDEGSSLNFDERRSENEPAPSSVNNINDDGGDDEDREQDESADFRHQRRERPMSTSAKLIAIYRSDDANDSTLGCDTEQTNSHPHQTPDESTSGLKSPSFSPISSACTDPADLVNDGGSACSRRSKPSPSTSNGCSEEVSGSGGRKQLLVLSDGDIDLTGEDYDRDESDDVREARQRQMYQRFQAWALRNYGEAGKTKTVTRIKYDRIVAILSGREPPTADNSKLRFWIKAKGFRLGLVAKHEAVAPDESLLSAIGGCRNVLYVPAKNWVRLYNFTFMRMFTMRCLWLFIE